MIQFQVACLCWSLGERGLRIFLRKEGKSLGFPEGADVVTSNHTSPERDFPLQARTVSKRISGSTEQNNSNKSAPAEELQRTGCPQITQRRLVTLTDPGSMLEEN